MTAPTLDDCLTAFAHARGDLRTYEAEAKKVFGHLEELQRTIREKRALADRLRAECLALIPEEKGAA